jgi:uncharacterized membrane protein
LIRWLHENLRLVLVVETLFLIALVGWAFVRSFSPEITTAGGEKFMELAFLNGILRSDRFPPQDPWLAGFAISYYYFGYVMLATLTQLSGLAASVAFNVGLATWFALTLTAAFGVAFDLVAALVGKARSTGVASYAGGLLGALFVGLVSNLAGFLESMQGLGLGSLAFWRWLDIKDLNCLGGPGFTEPIANCPQAGGLLPERFFWWWRASRVINDRDLLGNAVEVIDEFPFFSFLLGDMHPHVLALPFVLLAIGLALALLLAAGEGWSDQVQLGSVRSLWDEMLGLFPLGWVGLLLFALCLGALAFLNTWDFPIYVFLVTLVVGVRLAWQRGGLDWGVFGRAALVGLGLGVLGALLYLPFYVGFQSQAGGILPNFLFPTRLSQFFVMFGPLLVAVIFLLIALSQEARGLLMRVLAFLPWSLLLPIAFLLLTLLVGTSTSIGQDLVRRLMESPIVREQVGDLSLAQLAGQVARIRIMAPWAYLLLAGLLAWVLGLLGINLSQSRRLRPGEEAVAGLDQQAPAGPQVDRLAAQAVAPSLDHPAGSPATTFSLVALLVAFLLVFSVEFVYLRDTFGTRMNTVFKFYFQAWVLMGLVAAFAVVYLARYATRWLRTIGLALVALLTVAGLFYPVLATYTRAEGFVTQPTLDGTAYLASQHPGDAAAIAWLQANVPANATVLEASGGSYTYAGRVSAQTGLPTLLGWEGHQLQWRGNTVEQDLRRPDIELIYRNASPVELEELLNKWQLDYVIVGDLERRTYGLTPQSEARLARAMDLVYEAEDVRIYRRR